MTDEIKNIGCDCGIVLPQRVEEKMTEKQNVEGLVDKNFNSEAAFITTKSLNISPPVQEGEQISEVIQNTSSMTSLLLTKIFGFYYNRLF